MRVAFGTYNDGKDGATAMYVDDASLTTLLACAPRTDRHARRPRATTSARLPPRAYLPLILRHSPRRATDATPTPTVT